MKKLIIALGCLLLIGCSTTAQYEKGSAIVTAAERTACLTAILVCNQLSDPVQKTACSKTATDICAVTPGLVKSWSEIARP